MSYHEAGYVEYLEREAATLLDEVKRLQAELAESIEKGAKWARAAAAAESRAIVEKQVAALIRSELKAARARATELAVEVDRLQKENEFLQRENRRLYNVDRLRTENAFFRGRLEIISAKMDGEHVWRFSSGGPPFVGPNVDEVMRRVVEALQSGPATTKNDCLQ